MPQMLNLTDPLTLEALAQVSTEGLVPSQQPTPRWLLQQADCYLQYFLKYPDLAVCHSHAEYLYYILLEIDPDVSAFVPQPFKLKISGQRKAYIPDCYVVRKGQPQVIELKAPGGMDDPKWKALTAFFNWHNLPFSLISNEAVLEREQEALHWLPIIQALVYANDLAVDTQVIEREQYAKILDAHTLQLSDLLTPGLRTEQWRDEVAFYRLMYSHHIDVNLQDAPLDWSTEVSVCC